MCLAVPMKVTAVTSDEVVVELHGVTQRARRDLLDEVAVGDHVIIHAGYALTVLDEAEAESTWALFDELQPGDADAQS
ncbi:MAG: HypC/HybG/HupF family hydrogenase formation chaperone [Fimbriimonadaceae bacterium]|nr:HypC/HybG/HupF family hydrogenase formation chaperone [Fimbriimonadaceae bacterium]